MAKKTPTTRIDIPGAGGPRIMRPAASTEVVSATDAELAAAGVVTVGAELVAALVADVSVAIANDEVSRFLASRQTESPVQDNTTRRGWNYARQQLQRNDFAHKPFCRIIGRVLQVLLNHREFRVCTGGDVFEVLLVEIPSQLEHDHRQDLRNRQRVDVTEPGGRRIVTGRMKRLRDDGLIEPTVTRASGREENFVLTEDGQYMFEDWPALEDIPGLELSGPVMPETGNPQPS